MAYRDKVRIGATHGARGRFERTGIAPYQRPTVTKTGTSATSQTEVECKAGGETIILTLANGTWNKNTAAFEAARQAFIDGMVSAQSEAGGWNLQTNDAEVVGSVVRTSDTVLTYTVTADTGYATTATETVTITIPAAIMEGQIEDLAGGTFQIITT